MQDVSGTMQMQRPGKFYWNYNQPFAQKIISDGHKIWIYDPSLNQVTVRSAARLLGSSPALLLSGDKNLNTAFHLKDVGIKNGLEWIEGTPRDSDSGFDIIKLGFKDGMLHEIHLHDNYGNTTAIEFTNSELNPKLEPDIFQFSPPAGVDVLEDGV